jgi:hypothetical protein
MTKALKNLALEAQVWDVAKQYFCDFCGRCYKTFFIATEDSVSSRHYFGAATFSITTLSMKGLFATLSINDIQYT